MKANIKYISIDNASLLTHVCKINVTNIQIYLYLMNCYIVKTASNIASVRRNNNIIIKTYLKKVSNTCLGN